MKGIFFERTSHDARDLTDGDMKVCLRLSFFFSVVTLNYNVRKARTRANFLHAMYIKIN